MKVTFDADVVIVGWTEGEGEPARGSLGSLMMAVYDDGDLRYVGNVGTGFGAVCWRRLSIDSMPSPSQSLRFRWRCCAPVPNCAGLIGCRPGRHDREHRGLTSAGRLRAPSFKGFPGGQSAGGLHFRSHMELPAP